MTYLVYADSKRKNVRNFCREYTNGHEALIQARELANSRYWINVRIELKPNKEQK